MKEMSPETLLETLARTSDLSYSTCALCEEAAIEVSQLRAKLKKYKEALEEGCATCQSNPEGCAGCKTMEALSFQ